MISKNVEECLKDLYELGLVQGEHNIKWADEYNLLEHSISYFKKTHDIVDKYGINCDKTFEDYRESDGEKEYVLWDRMASHMVENTKERILLGIMDALWYAIFLIDDSLFGLTGFNHFNGMSTGLMKLFNRIYKL